MKTFILLFVLLTHVVAAQVSVDSISEAAITRMLNYLASDSLKGRGNYTPELHIAAHFIEQKFKEAGLKKVLHSYLQPFTTKDVAANDNMKDSAGNYDPKKVLFNVIGMLPGKSLPNEIILFSAHYDHMGIQKEIEGDSICNGANDDASGTVALLALASYFAKRGDNERTLMFCAFAGEELGLFGSKAFVKKFDVNAIKADINIEMIGRHSGYGKKTVFITGATLSSFQAIFRKYTKGYIKIQMEPDVRKNLFSRSDNYSFALQGIPAHSIMSSDDTDDCYHQTCDEVNRIDIANMTTIIRAIAMGSQSIIDGTDTPLMRR